MEMGILKKWLQLPPQKSSLCTFRVPTDLKTWKSQREKLFLRKSQGILNAHFHENLLLLSIIDNVCHGTSMCNDRTLLYNYA